MPAAEGGARAAGAYRSPWARETEDEAINAGRMAALLYGVGGVSGLLMLVLPGVHIVHTWFVLVVAAAGLSWAAVAWLLVDWRRIPAWVTHTSCAGGLPITVLIMAYTGGSNSPGRFYLYFIVVYAAYFYRRRVVIRYLIGCSFVALCPLFYEAHKAIDDGYLAELTVVIPTYFVLGLGILTGKEQLIDQSTRAERLAGEQAALRRVATAVAAGISAYTVVAEEAAHLLGASGGTILRFADRGEGLTGEIVGSWATRPGGLIPDGTSFLVADSPVLSHLATTGETVRKDEEGETTITRLGYRSSITAPVRVDGRLWGALSIGSEDPAAWIGEPEARLALFADLLATAIGNTEDREKLAAQASADPLTGLANHRTFHERLGTEVTRAQRHGRALSLAVIDVDNFKQVNDTHGHEAGDRVLAAVGEILAEEAREEDVLARIGGDEFAWLLPESDRLAALAALERARGRIIAAELATISVGICDLELAANPEDLFRFADGALYWSKVNGRNTTWLYDPQVVQDLSAKERAEHLERSQALIGLRALARAIDAKDVSTREHSERVAEMSARLATASGWSATRVALLREAALVHDVGKIGVPDAILLKPGRLTADEYEVMKGHAELSAQIVADVLRPEQVAWVRAHHERPDGGGYPRGLTHPEIPEGAALLALADAWDVMVASRPYSLPKTPAEAIAECRRLRGEQFTAAAVAALERVLAEETDVATAPAAEASSPA